MRRACLRGVGRRRLAPVGPRKDARPCRRDRRRAVACVLAAAGLVAAAPAAEGAKKFQVVTFGDSFASGEGAPAVDGDYGADGSRIGNLRSDRPDATPYADWDGSAADRAFTGDSASDARLCHRSPKATSPVAVRLLETRFPGVEFTFRSFACSGARVEEGVYGDFEGAEPNDPVPPQISQANAYLGNLPAGHAKRIDALVMNVGGNNLGFGNLIERCENIGPAFPFNPCNPRSFGGLGNDDALRVFETGVGSGESAAVIGLDDVPQLYRELDRKIDRVSGASGLLDVRPGSVFLTGPPNPLAGPNGCATLTGGTDYEKNLQATEIAWLQQDILPRMVAVMRASSGENGWEFVDMSSRTPNGMCSGSGRMFNRNRDALRTQGATIASDLGFAVSHGIAHPNRAGFAAMAPALADALAPKVIAAFTPSTPPSATPAPLLTLAPRVQLRLPAASEDYATRPAARLGTQTIAGAAGTGIGTIDVPVSAPAATDAVSVEVRRCGPLAPGASLPQGCSAVRSIPGILVGTPGRSDADLGPVAVWRRARDVGEGVAARADPPPLRGASAERAAVAADGLQRRRRPALGAPAARGRPVARRRPRVHRPRLRRPFRRRRRRERRSAADPSIRASSPRSSATNRSASSPSPPVAGCAQAAPSGCGSLGRPGGTGAISSPSGCGSSASATSSARSSSSSRPAGSPSKRRARARAGAGSAGAGRSGPGRWRCAPAGRGSAAAASAAGW